MPMGWGGSAGVHLFILLDTVLRPPGSPGPFCFPAAHPPLSPGDKDRLLVSMVMVVNEGPVPVGSPPA